MSVVMIMNWPDVSLDKYEEVRKAVNWETNVPAGAQYHVASHDGSALRVTDVWDSGEQFNEFVEKRLMPACIAAGVTTQPNVEVYPAYATFAPNAK